MYMIMSGLVELIASKPVEGPLLSHLGGSGDETLCIDLEDSFMLDCPILMPTAVLKDGKLHIDRAAAEDIKQQMSKLLMGRGQEYVTEVRGPGQVIGEVSFTKANQAVAQHQMSARAKEAVVVVELTESSLRASLKQVCAGRMASGCGMFVEAPMLSMFACLLSFLKACYHTLLPCRRVEQNWIVVTT